MVYLEYLFYGGYFYACLQSGILSCAQDSPVSQREANGLEIRRIFGRSK